MLFRSVQRVHASKNGSSNPRLLEPKQRTTVTKPTNTLSEKKKKLQKKKKVACSNSLRASLFHSFRKQNTLQQEQIQEKERLALAIARAKLVEQTTNTMWRKHTDALA